jgi:predicted nucleotidyltransferase
MGLSSLQKDLRVAGVDKRLMLIEPYKEGHLESSVVDQEEQAAKVVGVSVETVLVASVRYLRGMRL